MTFIDSSQARLDKSEAHRAGKHTKILTDGRKDEGQEQSNMFLALLLQVDGRNRAIRKADCDFKWGG